MRQTVAQAQAALDAAWDAFGTTQGLDRLAIAAASDAIHEAAKALQFARAQAEEDAAITAHYERCHKAGVSGGD